MRWENAVFNTEVAVCLDITGYFTRHLECCYVIQKHSLCFKTHASAYLHTICTHLPYINMCHLETVILSFKCHEKCSDRTVRRMLCTNNGLNSRTYRTSGAGLSGICVPEEGLTESGWQKHTSRDLDPGSYYDAVHIWRVATWCTLNLIRKGLCSRPCYISVRIALAGDNALIFHWPPSL
jgi:hypothetical protein